MSGQAFLTLAVLLAALVGSAIGVVNARQESRRLFVELNALEDMRDELNVDFGRLQLEQATWAEPQRIERLAREELGMLFPAAVDTRVIRR